jgi:site-specific DNA-cytosine methylase
MNILYLASFKANHPNWNITYQDINGKRDIDGDMMDVDLTNYDIIIATPPCNYYSRANYRREISEYSQNTKHLLPGILKKLKQINKPYIVENVLNYNLMKEFYDQDFVYQIGRHTYWTNIPFNYQKNQIHDDIHNSSKSKRQGGQNVHDVIEFWLQNII